MNEMDGRHQGLNSYPDWSVRPNTLATNGKHIPRATGYLHDTSGLPNSDPSPGKKERKEWWAEGLIVAGSAAGVIYGVVLIVQRFILGG